ncbi:MAG: imidazole glycerol phosphate synthase subunit HisH [Planctomycetota bacterium]|nr:imidazole glycerol phosphate synthase subunit HisH [Planctomycetota bacterium]
MVKEVIIARTGTANLASIRAGLTRAGASPRMAESADEIRDADYVMLPGVGSFGAAMGELIDHGHVSALKERFRENRPTMAICVGLQLLCHGSEEDPEVEGLSIVDAQIGRFHGDIRVPQMGWNKVAVGDGCQFLKDGYAYFANSYRLEALPKGWSGALSSHGGEFVAAMERGSLLACQFHPELSGAWGGELMARWLSGGQ